MRVRPFEVEGGARRGIRRDKMDKEKGMRCGHVGDGGLGHLGPLGRAGTSGEITIGGRDVAVAGRGNVADWSPTRGGGRGG